MSTVRIATLDAPHFACGPVEVGRAWADVEVTPLAREVLLAYVGRIVQIHPSDVAGLAALGLALDDGRLVNCAPPDPRDHRSGSSTRGRQPPR